MMHVGGRLEAAIPNIQRNTAAYCLMVSISFYAAKQKTRSYALDCIGSQLLETSFSMYLRKLLTVIKSLEIQPNFH